MGKIILNFPPKTSKEEKIKLSEFTNIQLESINSEVNSWNGFVDVIKTKSGEYRLIGNCDNEEVRIKMQDQLDTIQVNLYPLLKAV